MATEQEKLKLNEDREKVKREWEKHNDIVKPIPCDMKHFTGQVLTLVPAPHPEGFADFKIVRLTIEENKVKKTEYLRNGTYYGLGEAVAWLDALHEYFAAVLAKTYPKTDKGESYRVA